MNASYWPEGTIFGEEAAAARYESLRREHEERARQERIAENLAWEAARKKTFLSEISARYRSASLLDYNCMHEDYSKEEQASQKKVLTSCLNYAHDFPNVGNMIMCGNNGCGKTYLSFAIYRDVVEKGFSVKRRLVQDLIADIRKAYHVPQGGMDTYAQFINPDLLIIDEVGKQFGSDAEKTEIFHVLNKRYEDGQPTILISNMGDEGVRQYLGESVLSRFTGAGCETVIFDWRDGRPVFEV